MHLWQNGLWSILLARSKKKMFLWDCRCTLWKHCAMAFIWMVTHSQIWKLEALCMLSAQHNKQHNIKELLSSFRLNGYTRGCHPQNYKLEPHVSEFVRMLQRFRIPGKVNQVQMKWTLIDLNNIAINPWIEFGNWATSNSHKNNQTQSNG